MTDDTKKGARIEPIGGGAFEVWNNQTLIATCPTEFLAGLVLEGVSHRLDSRAAWSFGDALARARGVLKARQMGGVMIYDPRALALVLTKLDEAELWFTKVVVQ